MSDGFSPGAVRLARLAARCLGWRPAEFWAATPAELRQSLGAPADEPGAMDRATLIEMMGGEAHGR